jgi:hypothetical protein
MSDCWPAGSILMPSAGHQPLLEIFALLGGHVADGLDVRMHLARFDGKRKTGLGSHAGRPGGTGVPHG